MVHIDPGPGDEVRWIQVFHSFLLGKTLSYDICLTPCVHSVHVYMHMVIPITELFTITFSGNPDTCAYGVYQALLHVSVVLLWLVLLWPPSSPPKKGLGTRLTWTVMMHWFCLAILFFFRVSSAQSDHLTLELASVVSEINMCVCVCARARACV